MPYRTIIFDLDGTLLNTIDDLTTSINYALQLHGYSIQTSSYVRQVLGKGIRRLVADCLPSSVLEGQGFEHVFSDFRTHYLQHNIDKTVPYDGVLSTLSCLKLRDIGLAMVSNKVDTAVQDLHQRFFADTITVAIGEGPKTPPKPNPIGVLRAMEMLQATPETTLYVGDSEVDYATAQAAGIDSCLVLWGFRDEEQLCPLGAQHYIKQPHELLTLVD